MLYDFVILLNGNSYVSCIQKQEIQSVEQAIVRGIFQHEQWIKLQNGDRIAQINPGAIQGWYFKPHEKSIQEKQLDLLNKAIEPPEDDWKHEE